MTKQTLYSLASRVAHLEKVLLGAVALAVMGAVSTPVLAQESLLMEEITVTAQKREQGQQDVGIAITAISGDQLRALGYTNAQEVTALAPGVSTIQPNGEANYAIGIRGVANNDFVTNVESPVALYVDEVYISQMSGAGFLLFDIERVEILRGPQGTLFGRNATGGLVHYITKKPSQEFEGYGSLSYGRWNRIKVQGGVTAPISDSLSMRVSVATHQGDGYIENREIPGSKLNNANEVAGRIQLLFELSENASLLLNARFGDQDIRTGFFEYVSAVFPDSTPTPGVPNSNLGGYEDTDGDVYAGDYDFQGKNDLKTRGYSATLNWDFGAAKLTSITDYQTVDRDYIEDSDASPTSYFNFFLTTNTEQFSQELRLAGERDGMKWVAGFYYMDLDVNDSNGIIGPYWDDLLPLFGLPPGSEIGVNAILNPYTTQTETWSVFGQLEFDLSDTLTAVGGFRWIEEDKTHEYRSIFVGFDPAATSALDPRVEEVFDGVDPYSGTRDDGNWSARIQLGYHPSDDLLFYASWNRGVKSGGFNAPILPTAEFVTDELMNYGPEKLDAYEVGTKWDFADGKARLNLAAYYYDYKDYQAFSILVLDTFALNAQSKNKGFEAEFLAAPVQGLDLLLGVAYTDAKVTDVPGVTIDVETPLGPVLAIVPGATLTPVQTPKWNYNGLVRYEVPMGGGSLALQADFQYRSKHFFNLLQTPASVENGYSIFNASATWFAPGENWSLRFFIQNLTDEEYLVQTFDLSGNIDNGGVFVGMIEQYYGRPRSYGVNVTYSF